MALGGKNTYWAHATHGSPSSNNSYVSSTRSLSVAFDGEEVDATVFGDAYRDYEQSFKNATINVTYKYSTAMWQVIADLYANGTSITFELGPDGTTSTYPKITGSMVLINFNQGFDVGSLEEIPVTFRVTGAPTFTTYS